MQNAKTLLEYIWIDGKGELRSKSRVIHATLPFNISFIPEWTYDGSSTWQADCNGDTEIVLKPCAVYKDASRSRNVSGCDCFLVLCETYTSDGTPLPSNHRHKATAIFTDDLVSEHEPWFGLEQEYFMILPDDYLPNVHKKHVLNHEKHYCGIAQHPMERTIAEEHLQLCLKTNLHISGINAEVSPCQWEFQIGPCVGIESADELIVARYLLEKIASYYGVNIQYHPKPYSDINGSGCHINVSTIDTRSCDGITEIYKCISNLGEQHEEVLKSYGSDNQLRLTGLHETSSYTKFTWGVGTRNTSIRIPNKVQHEKCGYFEDRRPASNIDPYIATSTLFHAML